MTIWDNKNDLIQLIEMCIYLPINLAICIPTFAVYFGRESYMLFHLLTRFRLLPKNSKVDKDTVAHRWPLYLLMHIYVIYAVWNVIVTICMIIRPLVNDFVFNEIIQRAFYNYNLQWYFTLVAAFVLVWYRAASIWIQERNSTFLKIITHQYLLYAVLGILLLVALFMHTLYIIVIPIYRGGAMVYDTYTYFSTTITVLTFSILLSLFLLIITFGTIIIVIVTQSNRMLVRTWREKGQKVPKQLMNRVILQRWTIGKFFFVIAAMLLALLGKTCGHIMFTMQANPTLRQALPPWMIENVLRGPFDWLVMLAIALVFWPWKLPNFLIKIFTATCSLDKNSLPGVFQPIDLVRDILPSPKGKNSPKGGDDEDKECKEDRGEQLVESSETPQSPVDDSEALATDSPTTN